MEDRRNEYDVFVIDRLAVHKNIAENGRLFCQLIFAACMLAFLARHDATFARLGLLAALPVGLSCIVDQLQPGRRQTILSLAVYALAALVALAFFVLI